MVDTPDKPEKPTRRRRGLGETAPVSGQFRQYEVGDRIRKALKPVEEKPVEDEPLEEQSEPVVEPVEPEIPRTSPAPQVVSIGPSRPASAPRPSRPTIPQTFSAKISEEPKKKKPRGLWARITGKKD